MPSVVIAAHNEESTIGDCLAALEGGADSLEVIVVANGCTDDTAVLARQRPGVLVMERPEPGKTGALNAGDHQARLFPRLYLDADIVLGHESVDRLAAELGGSILACAPRRWVDTSHSSLGVRAYYAINNRLPVFGTALFGRGAIMVSEEGHARFGSFPNLVADDLFLDSVFAADERVIVHEVVSRVAAPERTSDLFRRLVRVRRGNRDLREDPTQSSPMRPSDTTAWFGVVLRDPRLLPAGVVYVSITIAAEWQARRSAGSMAWGRQAPRRRSPR